MICGMMMRGMMLKAANWLLRNAESSKPREKET